MLIPFRPPGIEALVGDKGTIDTGEAKRQLVSALEVVVSRIDSGRGGESLNGIIHALVKGIVYLLRIEVGSKTDGEVQDTLGSVLVMGPGELYPPVAHEALCFLPRPNTTSAEVVHVVCPLAAAILIQPVYVHLRNGFLLKLSAALAMAHEHIKYALVMLQIELQHHTATHTAAHVDIVGGWSWTLANTSLSLQEEITWERASAMVVSNILCLVQDLQECDLPIMPLLSALQPIVAEDPLCLAEDIAFLGACALQSSCVHERSTLLSMIGEVVGALKDQREGYNPHCHAKNLSDPEDTGQCTTLTEWSISVLEYPVVSLAATGNAPAKAILPLIEALQMKGGCWAHKKAGEAEPSAGSRYSECPWKCTTFVLALRRLCVIKDNEEALLCACRQLEGRAIIEGINREDKYMHGRSRAVEGHEGQGKSVGKDTGGLELGLCAIVPLLHHPSGLVQMAACQVVVAIARVMPLLGVRLLPLMLHTLKKCGEVGDAHGVDAVLRVLPELGKHRVASKAVSMVIHGLARAQLAPVQATGLRLAATLWEINSR
ncbi:unnamed protein product [Choristocarpus tenellus]